MSKHTPGPWTVSEQFGSVGAIKAGSGFVAFPACSVREIDETRGNGESWLDMRERTEPARKALADEVNANARLIASAPEQNELLQIFTEWARQVSAREDVPKGIRYAATGLADAGRRLIAKATGENNA